jgi:hypothetical protein
MSGSGRRRAESPRRAAGIRMLPTLVRSLRPLRSLLRGRRAPLLAAGVAVALVAGAVTPGIVPVAAAWTDREWAKGRIGAEDVDCATSTAFTTTADARFLRGSLLGLDLGTVASLRGLSAVDDAAPGSRPTPAGAPSPATGVYVDPLVAGVVGDAAVLDLTGLSAGLPVGSAGALNQYVRVTGSGTSAAASGLVADSGGVGVTSGATSASLPGRATISLDRVLARVDDATGTQALTSTRLAVGAVASSSTFDWCQARRSAVWGGGPATGPVRQYGIAGLELQAVSPAVVGITTATTATAGTGLAAASALLSGTAGSASPGAVETAIRDTLVGLLGSLGLKTLSGTISVTGVEAAVTAITPLVTAPLVSADGTVAVDLASGRISVDLARLLGDGADGLNGQAPNTELVVNATVLNAVAARVGALIDGRTAEIRSRLLQAIEQVTVKVDVTAELTLAGLSVLRVRMQYDGRVADLAASSARFTVGATILGADPLGVVAGLVGPLVSGLTTGLVGPVLTAVRTGLTAPVTTLGSDLAALSGRAVSAVATLVAGLPRALSVQVNVQPDRPGAPAGTSSLPAVGRDTSAAYSVTALRIGLLPAASPNGTPPAVLELATSTAGRNTYRAP